MSIYKDHLQLLKNIALKIAFAETPREVIEVVLNMFEDVLHYSTAAVIFFDKSMRNFNVFRTEGMNEAERRYVTERIPRLTKEIISLMEDNNLQPVLWDEATVRKGVFFNSGNMKTFFWLPVVVHKKPIGAMSLSWRNPHTLDETLMEVFAILGNLLGGELQKLQRSFQTIYDQEQKISALTEELSKCSYFDRHSLSVIGNDPKMKAIYETIMSVADTDVNVLIEGDTGTGKELIADYVHYLSHRNKGPFVKVNCGALSETLLESELFGHVKGAFTGAYKNRLGRFEMAEGGTLFLDEICEMSTSMQVRLLRVLQEGVFERVGDSRPIKVNVRIICATNKNLEDAVQAKEFRKDLFYRLNVIYLHVPPLRERLGDIPLFIGHFIEKYNAKYHLSVSGVSTRALGKCYSYSWPGNVRELENVIERAVVTCNSDTIEDLDLHDSVLPDLSGVEKTRYRGGFLAAKKRIVERFEKEYLTDILRKNGGSITRSAQEVGLNRKNLYLKMRKHNILRTHS